MKLIELKAKVDYLIERGNNDDLDVCVPNCMGYGMGGMNVTHVKGVCRGIDWDSKKFIIWTDVEMINKPKKP